MALTPSALSLSKGMAELVEAASLHPAQGFDFAQPERRRSA
ncbi:hypothetical protein NUH86_00030 [Sphingobium sp. JS3065]|nr:hypothetical protein [Sphingobium sp. JS3065]UZW55245.1 hypothetical protein NUH86_00030 [Sphingobium sp. JS3065]